MKSTHPYKGLNKRLTPSPEAEAFAASIKAPPTVAMKERVKPYWKEQQLRVNGPDGKPLGMGVVPAGDYTNPETPEASAAVVGLYKHLNGTPISRHLVAVLLNFQVSDDVDKVRASIKEAGITDVDPGARGRSVRWIGAGAVTPTKATKAAKADDTPAKGTPKADPTPAKGTPKAPAGSRPAKAAAKAAAEAAPPVEEKVAS